MKKCELQECQALKECWHGFKESECPRRKLENQRLLYGLIIVLLVGAVVLLTV